MGWRTICINEAIRLNYKLNSLGVLQKDEIVWINLDEIDIIIVETLMCNLSLKLLSELASKGITMIVCGEDHMPIGNFISIMIIKGPQNLIDFKWSGIRNLSNYYGKKL